MDYEILCHLDQRQDLYHASHLYAGLCDLLERGLARVSFNAPRGALKLYVSDPTTVCLTVKCLDTGKDYLLVVDLRDSSNLLTMPLVERADIYLKRSYYEPDLLELPPQLKEKIVPFGLNYACRNAASTSRVLSVLAPRLAFEFLRSPRKASRQLNPRSSNLYQYLTTALESEFEQEPDEELEPTVLFQTRVYESGDIHPDDPLEINEGRVRLVRALKKAFGPKFRGGLVPTAYAKELYPDAVSEQPTRQSQYIAWGKRSLIGIYTRGLHHSLAFKLPEYLAASKCVVSEPLRNSLPTPLVAGEHYLEFRTPEECVEQCARLLENEGLAKKLRRAAWDYYRKEVKPSAHVEGVLRRALGANCPARSE